MAPKIGVQNSLAEDARIFYSHHFKARSVGRVSDLISACLKEKNLDPLQLRASILYALYTGYSVSQEPLDVSLTPPSFSLEVGSDDKNVFVSLSIHLNPRSIETLKSLKTAISEKRFASKIEKSVFELGCLTETLQLRHFKEESALEILFKLGADTKNPPSIIWSEYEAASKEETRKADYIELGDVDYLKALSTHLTGKEMVLEVSETTITGRVDPAAETIKVKCKPEKTAETEQKFKGNEAEAEFSQTVNGDRNEKIPEVQMVSGGKNSDTAEHKTVFTGTNSKPTESTHRFTDSGKKEGSGPEAVTIVGGTTHTSAPVGNFHSSSDPSSNALSGKDTATLEGPLGFLKSVWPFSKPEPAKAPEVEKVTVFKSDSSQKSANEDTIVIKSESPKTEEEKAFEKEDDETFSKSETAKLFSELDSFDLLKEGSALKRVMSEMEKSPDRKMQEWRETLKKELQSEKQKMNETVKNLGRQTRVRENEFLAKERSAASELRKKEEIIRQKETLLQQKSEQVAQASMNMERLKIMGNGGVGTKLKLNTSTKLVSIKDDEIVLLNSKLKEMEDRLMVAQAKGSSNPDLQVAAKLQLTEKRLEDLKRVNQRLTELMQKAQDKKNVFEDSDNKRKFESLERQHFEVNKNLEKTSQKLKESQEAERRNAIEVGRLQEENKKMKLRLTRAGLPTGEAA